MPVSVITRDGQAEALYLVVETKGYDNQTDIPENERWKIESARQFFTALGTQGIKVEYRTKIKHETLAQLIQQIDAEKPLQTA